MYNDTLYKLARWRLDGQLEKRSFVPPGAGDPSGGGGAPPPPGGDPSMGGGAPPPDPSMAGGMPPPDPMAGGGVMPPPPAGGDPSMGGGAGGGADISEVIRSVIKQELAAAGQGAPGAGGPGGGAGGPGKTARPDIVTVANDIFQVKKLITYVMNMFQIPMPPDILDGPNRDPATGAPMPPGTPGSTSDPSQQQMPPPPASNSAIKPISAMQPAMPTGAGPEKQSADRFFQIGSNVAAEAVVTDFQSISGRAALLAKLARSLRERKES